MLVVFLGGVGRIFCVSGYWDFYCSGLLVFCVGFVCCLWLDVGFRSCLVECCGSDF